MQAKLKIYTRTGDRGQTSLYGGKRVDKFDQRVVAYGTVDELNSALGIVIAHLGKESREVKFLSTIQSDLFAIGAHLAGGKKKLNAISDRVKEMERFIDAMDRELTPLKNFILPGGSIAASFAHLSRSICRRAEREVIRLATQEKNSVDGAVIIYLNRLSDFLFQIARFMNLHAGVNEVTWQGTNE